MVSDPEYLRMSLRPRYRGHSKCLREAIRLDEVNDEEQGQEQE